MPPKNAQAMWVLHPETASQNADCWISSGAEAPLFGGVGFFSKMQHCLYSKPKDTVLFFFNFIFRHTQFVRFAQAKKASQKAKVLLSKWETNTEKMGQAQGILRPQDHQDQRTRHLLLGSLLIVTVGQSLECSLFHCLVSKDFPKKNPKIFQRF